MRGGHLLRGVSRVPFHLHVLGMGNATAGAEKRTLSLPEELVVRCKRDHCGHGEAAQLGGLIARSLNKPAPPNSRAKLFSSAITST